MRSESGNPKLVPLRWRHVIINTRNSWLHGDPRGFRDRDHRKHSSGDYKNPPPAEEHSDLRRYFRKRAGDQICLPPDVRPKIAEAIAGRLIKEMFRVLAISVGHNHSHSLVELPDDVSLIKAIFGRCKRDAVEAITLAGSIWAAGGEFKPIRDREHHENTFQYITKKQERGAWVWTFRREGYWME